MSAGIRERYAALERWLTEHLLVRWLFLAVIPGAAYAGVDVLLDTGPLAQSLILGAVFGGTFATLTVLVQHVRGPDGAF